MVADCLQKPPKSIRNFDRASAAVSQETLKLIAQQRNLVLTCQTHLCNKQTAKQVLTFVVEIARVAELSVRPQITH